MDMCIAQCLACVAVFCVPVTVYIYESISGNTILESRAAGCRASLHLSAVVLIEGLFVQCGVLQKDIVRMLKHYL